MCRLIFAFVVRIWHKQVFSWRGSYKLNKRNLLWNWQKSLSVLNVLISYQNLSLTCSGHCWYEACIAGSPISHVQGSKQRNVQYTFIPCNISTIISPVSLKLLKKTVTNIAVFSEKTDVPHLPNQSMVAISVMKLWPWKLGQGHQNLISYWSCPIYIGLQICIHDISCGLKSVRWGKFLSEIW